MTRLLLRALSLLAVAVLAAGCVAPRQVDYTAFKASRPRSILVLPPLNESPEVKASYSMLSHVTMPLAEGGYYVFPVALVDETFRQNGLSNPAEMHDVAPAKLREIFGADAVLYITVMQYGSRYMVLSSNTTVAAKARLVDLKTGTELWTGTATAIRDDSGSAGGLIGMLVTAAVSQIVNTVSDSGHQVAGSASLMLLSPGFLQGAPLYGPRHPKYATD